MLKFRTMVPNADAMKDSLRARNEAREGLFNWSLWGDVKIMLRTIPHVLGRRGL